MSFYTLQTMNMCPLHIATKHKIIPVKSKIHPALLLLKVIYNIDIGDGLAGQVLGRPFLNIHTNTLQRK